MKKVTRHRLVIIISSICIALFVIEDLLSQGTISSGSLGMSALLLGCAVVPSIAELRKEK